jgi:hypothetical protein
MEKKKRGEESILHHFSFLILPLSSRKALKRSTTQSPNQNKGFLNYVFCRNWAVRNLTGTRLDPV